MQRGLSGKGGAYKGAVHLNAIAANKRVAFIRTATPSICNGRSLRRVDESGEADNMQVVESSVWIPAEQPITDTAFLHSSNIWEVCQDLPIYWMFQTPLRGTELHEDMRQPTETKVRALRQTRDITDELPVNDYSEAGLELDSSLDDQGYCCRYCRRGYRYCRRYYEPLGGYWPYPYWHQGVVCQIVMPCNWWIARMLGRV